MAKRPGLPTAPTPPVPPRAPVTPPPTLGSSMAGRKFFMEWVKPIEKWRDYEDYGLFSSLEIAHLIIVGVEDITFTPEVILPPTPSSLDIPALSIVSPMGKGIIATNPLSSPIDDGQAVYIENVKFPIRGSTTKDLTIGSLGQRKDRRTDRIFLGARIGDSFYFRTYTGTGAPPVSPSVKDTIFIPIADGVDTTNPPGTLQELRDGNGGVLIRDFSGVTADSLYIPWEVPDDTDVGEGIKFRVLGFVTDSIFSHGASFKLGGYSIGDSDQLDGTVGTIQELVLSGSYAINDRFDTGWSSTVTVSNLAQGELAMLTFERDSADSSDTYSNSLAIYGIKLEFSREPVE